MEEIRRIREKVGLTQTQIALQLNVDQTTVARWEQNGCYPRACSLPALADLLHCSIDDLFGRGKEETKP